MSYPARCRPWRLVRRLATTMVAMALATPSEADASARQFNGCESFIRIVQSPSDPHDGATGTIIVEYGEITDVEPACFSAGPPSNFRFTVADQDRSAYFSHAPSPDGSYTIATATRRHLFLHDYRGSVVRIINREGTALDLTATTYQAFGGPGPSTPAAAATNPGYNGHESAGGLVYMRNRWYDPNSGRFTQEDPIGFAGGINLYGYVGNDPITYSDPFGLCPEDVTFWQAVGCVVIETSTALLGSGAGFIAGGGAGLLTSAPTGGLAAPLTVPIGAMMGAAVGGVTGKLAGEAITNVLFSKGEGEFRGGRQTSRDADHARLMREFNPDKAQRARIHREIGKRKQGRDKLDGDELREVFEEIMGEQ